MVFYFWNATHNQLHFATGTTTPTVLTEAADGRYTPLVSLKKGGCVKATRGVGEARFFEVF